MTRKSKHGPAYEAGTLAGRKNAFLHTNPYPVGPDRMKWLAGYHRARGSRNRPKARMDYYALEQIYLNKAKELS